MEDLETNILIVRIVITHFLIGIMSVILFVFTTPNDGRLAALTVSPLFSFPITLLWATWII